MAYSQEQAQALQDERAKKLNRDLTICRNVKKAVETEGWKDTIGPILDRMILDVLGGKIGENWVSGKVDRARSEEKVAYYIGFKQGLITFHQHVMNHIRQIEILEKQIKQIEVDKRKGPRSPLEETRYNPAWEG